MVSFLRLSPDDAPLLSELGNIVLVESHGRSASPEIMQQYLDNAFSIEACRKELQDEENLFHAIYDNNQLAGYSKITFNCPHSSVVIKPATKLKQLYLLKQFYDRQLGHKLIQHAIELSKSHGDKGMWLNVWKENDRAMRFYERQGFTIVGETDFVLTADHANPNWVMLLQYRHKE